MATAGSLPPLSSNGKTFINDPKITGNTEVKGSIKLKIVTPRNKDVLIVRNFQLSMKKITPAHNSSEKHVSLYRSTFPPSPPLQHKQKGFPAKFSPFGWLRDRRGKRIHE